MITASSKMADLLHYNINLLSIFKRLGIKLGFEDRSIKDICQQYQIDTHFFLEITRFFLDKEHFAASNLSSFKVSAIIEYLHKTHDYYLNYKFPLISSLIEKLLATNYDRKDLALVKKFFISYQTEFLIHIEREEKNVFPYVVELENALSSGNVSENLMLKIQGFPISQFAKEHDNIDEKLNDLRNIFIKYLPPLPNEEIVCTILHELFDLERDVKDHSLIEDKIMVPKVSELERLLLDTTRKGSMQ